MHTPEAVWVLTSHEGGLAAPVGVDVLIRAGEDHLEHFTQVGANGSWTASSGGSSRRTSAAALRVALSQ